MYAAVRQYEMGAGFVSDLMRVVDTEFGDALSREPGFLGYHVIASGSDEIVSVTVCEDEESAVRSNELAATFVRDRLAEFELNLTSEMSGEVGVTRDRGDLTRRQPSARAT
jgi:hypothetical protein